MPTIDYEDFHLEQLRDPQEAAAYLSECLDEGQDLFLLALRDVAKAQGLGMKELADNSDLNRENLYRMLSENGNPNLANVSTLLHQLGFRLQCVAGDAADL